MESRKSKWALAGLTLIAFVGFFDYTIVNTALPTIQSVFHVSVLRLQWVMNVYSLAVAATMILFGRLGDMYGRRLVFYAGAIILMLSSLGAGLSNHFWFLIICRGFQAIGVSATITLAVNIIIVIFGKKAPKAMVVYGIVTAVGLSVGPSLGGLLIQHGGWHWVFLINVPLIFIALLFCLPTVPESKADKKMPLDLGGAVLLVASLSLFIIGLIHGEQHSWVSTGTWGCLIASVILGWVLVKYEKNQTLPILNLGFFKSSHFAMAAMCTGLVGAVITAILFFMPLYLQHVRLYSPREVGLVLLAMPIAIILFSSVLGRISEKYPVKKILFSSYCFVFLYGVAHLWFTVDTNIILIIIALFLMGIAWSFCNVLTPVAAQHAVTEEQSGLAVGSVFTMFNVMAAVSLAVSTVLFEVFSREWPTADKGHAFVNGLHGVFGFLLLLSIIAIVVGVKLLRRKA